MPLLRLLTSLEHFYYDHESQSTSLSDDSMANGFDFGEAIFEAVVPFPTIVELRP